MKTFLAILLIFAMIATVFALARGIIAFLRTSHEDIAGPGPNLSGQRQNKAMRMRIFFQAIAVILIILILMLAGGNG